MRGVRIVVGAGMEVGIGVVGAVGVEGRGGSYDRVRERGSAVTGCQRR